MDLIKLFLRRNRRDCAALRLRTIRGQFATTLALILVCWLSLVDRSRAQIAATNASAYTFTTIAGYAGTGGADGVGDTAQFTVPLGVVLDTNGNAYVTDNANNTIRKVTPAGVVTTIAGFPGFSGSTDGTNSTARFYAPRGIATDRQGNLYVADLGNNTIRKLSPVGTNWIVTTIAGAAGVDNTQDGTGTNAQFAQPSWIAVDGSTNLYVVSDAFNVRKISLSGTNWMISTLASVTGFSIACDASGNLYLSDSLVVSRAVLVNGNWTMTTLAGRENAAGYFDGTNDTALFSDITALTVDANTNIYASDSLNQCIRKISPNNTNWVVSTVAGQPQINGYADGAGTNALFFDPEGLGTDAAGNIYEADTGNNVLREITPAGDVKTLVGEPGSAGSADGLGTAARFNQPLGLTLDGSGNIYVTDGGNNTIRQITSAGVVYTLAGSPGNSGSTDGVGDFALFSEPSTIAMDKSGNMYVADLSNDAIRKITPSGIVTTIAGLGQAPGYADGTGTNARFNFPSGIVVDSNTNLYVTDRRNTQIRKIKPSGTNWIVSSIAGSTNSGYADGTNGAAQFNGLRGIGIDALTNLYVADLTMIRKITPVGTNWVVTTLAGQDFNAGSSDGLGTNALFSDPYGVAADSAGNVYVTDIDNSNIRKLTPAGTNWFVTTIGGSATAQGSSDGLGSAALFQNPKGIAVDGSGAVYVADTGNNTIRKGIFTQYTTTNPVPFTQPPMTGSLMVMLQPSQANGQWRFPWDLAWRNSGSIASNLTQGNYTVLFRSLSGYLPFPSSQAVVVTAGQMTLQTNQYLPTSQTSGTNTGSLIVSLSPISLNGTGWRLLGESNWRPNDSQATNLIPDTYFVQFEPVNSYSPPATEAVQVFAGSPTIISASYLLAQSAPGGALLPTAVPANEISDINDYPFGFAGQIETDVAFGSGVAVQTNVVLTAAHLIFNDETLSYASQAYWFFRQETGVIQNEPLQAQGWYVLSGYASQRSNDIGSGFAPDQSSPQSRNFDVAALYFSSPVAGGGYGGFLHSDSVPNTWLTSTANKMLVGYPVDGSMFGDASIVPGLMYQSQPQPYPLNLDSDPVADQQVYTASWFFGYPGDSGGPFYVQFNGYYYPAGVYLGTLFNGIVPNASAVHAIDSNVVNLINFAAALGNNGTNNGGPIAGVLTIIPNQAINSSHVGLLQFQLGPPAAVSAGAAWRLQGGDTNYSTAQNYTLPVTTTNAISVQFKPIPGWSLPAGQNVNVNPSQITTNSAFYTVNNPSLAVHAQGIGLTGTTNTSYRIEFRTNLISGSWVGLSTNAITSTNFNLILPRTLLTNRTPTFYRAVWLP